jgi:translation elongation factor EF-4
MANLGYKISLREKMNGWFKCIKSMSHGYQHISEKFGLGHSSNDVKVRALVQKGSKSAGTIYFYWRFRLSTDCVISSGGGV